MPNLPTIAFAPGLASRFGGDNRFSTEVSPSFTAGGMTGDNRPAVSQPWGIGKGRETIIGQIGTTERLGNAWWPEVSFTLQTAGGDASPTIIDRTIRTKKGWEVGE